MVCVALLAALLGSGAFAQAVIELPPGGSTVVGGVTVVCVKSRMLPLCSLRKNGASFEIWSDENFIAGFAILRDALSSLKQMKISGACQ
jgi:hypothetical protein